MAIFNKPVKSLAELIMCEIPGLVTARSLLNNKIDALERNGIPIDDPRSRLTIDVIRRYIAFDMERMRAIEEKGKVTVVGITLALTLFFTGSSHVSTTINGLRNVSGFVMHLVSIISILAVLYLLIAGFCALKALRVKSITVFSIDDELHYDDYYEKVRRYLQVLDCNRLKISKYTNLVEVSYNAIRNGLVCTSVLVIIISATSWKPGPGTSTGRIDEKSRIIINNNYSVEQDRQRFR